MPEERSPLPQRHHVLAHEIHPGALHRAPAEPSKWALLFCRHQDMETGEPGLFGDLKPRLAAERV